MLRNLIVALVLVLPGANSDAQAVGSQMPRFELKGLSQSPAKSIAELEGRAILIDFFAFW
jgi:hypothetical protein